MTVISGYLRTRFFWVRHSTHFRKDWNVHFDFLHMLLCWSIHISFFCFPLLFLFHYETTVWLDYHSLTQTITEMTQFKMPCGTYDPFWLINTELTTLPEAHARCKGVIHLLSFVFTLPPEIQCMNYLFSQNYIITILQAEKSVRYNRSSIYRGSKGVIKCNNYLGQQGITIGVWCYGNWGPKNYCFS